MTTLLITLVSVLIAFVFLWIVFYRKDDSDKTVHFTCHVCDEKDCDCDKNGHEIN